MVQATGRVLFAANPGVSATIELESMVGRKAGVYDHVADVHRVRKYGNSCGSSRTARSYLPIIRIVNEPGTGVPCGPRPPPGGGAGAGPRSCDIVKRWPVLLSNVTVRAPFIVSRFCSTSKFAGLFSLTTVNVPLPCVLKASIVDGLKTAPSDPPA